MYIRRKVFSVIEGEDRLFSTTEYELNHAAIDRYFSDSEDEEEKKEKKGMSKAKKAAAILGGLALAAGGTYGLSKLASKNKYKTVYDDELGGDSIVKNKFLEKLAVPSEFVDKYGKKGIEWLKQNANLIGKYKAKKAAQAAKDQAYAEFENYIGEE